MDSRAILTERERQILTSDPDEIEDIKDVSQYRSKIRTRLRNRAELIEEDIAILHEHEPELAELFIDQVCPDDHQRLDRLEREMAEIREQLDI